MANLRIGPVVALFLALAAGPARSSAAEPPAAAAVAAQPTPAPEETPEQACQRCRKEREACKSACAGPSGDKVPSDDCLDRCENAYWRCVPAGHGCD